MLYLTSASTLAVRELQAEGTMGALLTPDVYERFAEAETIGWAADNACYAKGDRFDLGAYLDWLGRFSLAARQRCLFATAPDVVGDADATWARSRSALPLLRDCGYPAALVAQDGLANPPWDAFDVLFIGGTTEWKLSEDAYRLIAAAKERGKWVHVGRVNSGRRFRAMALAGADSVDGTHLAFGPDRKLAQIRAWLGWRLLPLATGEDTLDVLTGDTDRAFDIRGISHEAQFPSLRKIVDMRPRDHSKRAHRLFNAHRFHPPILDHNLHNLHTVDNTISTVYTNYILRTGVEG